MIVQDRQRITDPVAVPDIRLCRPSATTRWERALESFERWRVRFTSGRSDRAASECDGSWSAAAKSLPPRNSTRIFWRPSHTAPQLDYSPSLAGSVCADCAAAAGSVSRTAASKLPPLWKRFRQR